MWLQDLIAEPAACFHRLLRSFLAGAVVLGWLMMPVAAQTLTTADQEL